MLPPAFINLDGFVTIQMNASAVPGEGNGWLQTGLAAACKMYPLDNIATMFGRCLDSETPLIWRSPYKKNPGDETKCDDYWGALPLSKSWAQEVMKYAEEHGWDFDIGKQQRLEYRFDRFLGFADFLAVCAGEKIPLYGGVLLALRILLDAFSIDAADGNMMAYCRIQAVRRVSFVHELLARFWIRRVRARYGKIGGSWAAYFKPGHPMNEYDG